jgi:hypothetical protein
LARSDRSVRARDVHGALARLAVRNIRRRHHLILAEPLAAVSHIEEVTEIWAHLDPAFQSTMRNFSIKASR